MTPMESGAIMPYLVHKHVVELLMWQRGGLGPIDHFVEHNKGNRPMPRTAKRPAVP